MFCSSKRLEDSFDTPDTTNTVKTQVLDNTAASRSVEPSLDTSRISINPPLTFPEAARRRLDDTPYVLKPEGGGRFRSCEDECDNSEGARKKRRCNTGGDDGEESDKSQIDTAVQQHGRTKAVHAAGADQRESRRPTLPASDAAPRPGIDKKANCRTGTQR